jgi:hypothetical protein
MARQLVMSLLWLEGSMRRDDLDVWWKNDEGKA